MRTNRWSLSFFFVGWILMSQSEPRAVAQQSYPSTFLWGTALSAHQVEGKTGGGENADWYPFERIPGKIYGDDTADIATDHWNRYPGDFQLAASIGVNTIRTSVAWEKIEPKAGKFSEDVIQHYRAEFCYLKQLGLRPMITLLHGTVPLWFQNRGGWLALDSPQQFAAYVRFVVSKLGDLCDLWVTVNEPVVLIGLGYLEGSIPPQSASPESAILATWNLVRAHRLATATIHEVQPLPQPNSPGTPLRGVGLVNSLDLYQPYNKLNLVDDFVTGIYVELSNWAFPKAAVYGNFEMDNILGQLLGQKLSHPAGSLDIPEAHGNPVLDWLGVNYYTLWLVQYKIGSLPVLVVPPSLEAQKTDIGRAIYPAGTEQILRDTAAHFPNIPLVMTENGVSDRADNFRPQFIRDSLHYLDLAKFGHNGLPGLDIRGYYHWTLTDDFEWQWGYFSQYGLVQILRDQNLERVPRTSATVYCQEISGRLPKTAATPNCAAIQQLKPAP
jgi:beta-glucosidase